MAVREHLRGQELLAFLLPVVSAFFFARCLCRWLEFLHFVADAPATLVAPVSFVGSVGLVVLGMSTALLTLGFSVESVAQLA